MKQVSLLDQLSDLRKNRQILTIVLLLFVCVLFWITVTLFTSQHETKVDPELTRLAKPLNPNLDIDTLDTLESKRQYTEEELSDFTIYKVVAGANNGVDRVVPITVTQEELEQTEVITVDNEDDLPPLLLDQVESESSSESPQPQASPSPTPSDIEE